MEPQQLFLANGKAILPHLCGKCGRIWESLDNAERCCTCSYCGEFCDWRKGVSHDGCSSEAFRKSEISQLEKATLVPDYDGPFLWGDHVHMDVDDLLECVAPDELPNFGFCTNYQPPAFDLPDVMENIASNMHDEWEANDVPELEAAVALWNEANKDNGTYWEDRSRKWSKVEILKRASREADGI